MNLKQLLFKRNVFIGLAAAAQTLMTYNLLGLKADLIVAFFIFCGTVAIYNFHRITEKGSFFTLLHYLQFSAGWTDLVFILVPGLALLTSLFILSPISSGMLIISAIITLNYSLILMPRFFPFRLKNIGWIKSIIVTLVWVLMVDIIPALNEGIHPYFGEVGARFLFVYGITLPFDIRDVEKDLKMGIRTLPYIIGTRNAKFLSCLCLGCSAILMYNAHPAIQTGWVFTALISCIIIINNRTGDKLIYFRGYLDGMLILQYIAILLAQYLIKG